MQNNSRAVCLGSVVKTARQTKQLTQLQLAERLGITPRHLKAIENSGQKPSYDLFVRIVKELNVSVDYLLQQNK